jgi:hypothetical protein
LLLAHRLEQPRVDGEADRYGSSDYLGRGSPDVGPKCFLQPVVEVEVRNANDDSVAKMDESGVVAEPEIEARFADAIDDRGCQTLLEADIRFRRQQ